MKESKNKFGKLFLLTFILSVLSGALVGGIAGFVAGGASLSELENYLAGREQEDKQPKEQSKIDLKEESSAVVSAVEKASPAVVSIIVTKDVPKLDSFFRDPFFNDPFFSPFSNRDREDLETEKQEIGGGSGFIIDKQGHVITNRHVVSDKEADYTVMTNDGEELKAKVLARDNYLDIAVLKIEGDNFDSLGIGSSENLNIGQTVIAIGNSLGEFRNTVSKGIVSGLKRNVQASGGFGQTEVLDEVIQTDAAINPGNSGGPLLDLQGRVIGVNVAMAQGAENIGFAIPIDQVKSIYESVKKNGKIVRPYLGVRYVMLNESIQNENNLPFDYGALIIRGERRTQLAVIPGSPADKAGLVENDIILEIDGKKITRENDLADVIRKKEVGQEVTLKVWSKGETETVKATLEEAEL